ncbi:MAG TPA: isoleucine--tRNA ligase [bacterium]|nr:isoleucine--tRNA ligase [bacterium]
MDYSKTVYLPRTDFPMKANLSEREPHFLKIWEEKEIYKKIIKKNENGEKYILHDGPPYANGHIHLGTALNKILKDIVIKYKSLKGYYSPYKPGWDCHGMPIEHQIFTQLKLKKNQVDKIDFRKKAGVFAKQFVNIQREEFKRLGVLGEWEEPYLTLDKEYEGDIIKTFGQLSLSGYIYQTYKPIFWCINCETALAEAEIEYYDIKSPSIYVKFKVIQDNKNNFRDNTYFLIWTTTPWTLPSNTGIALSPTLNYAIVQTEKEDLIIGEKFVSQLLEKKGIKGNIKKVVKGTDLEGVLYEGPIIKRKSKVIMASFVSDQEGTGCVHIAPGHGEEDYNAGIKNGLEILSPVDEKGTFTDEVKEFAGKVVFDADKLIIAKLQKEGNLFLEEEIVHSYPHCWRCKKPVIYRSTKQWFLKVDHKNLRELLKKEIEKVNWFPPEGKNRIYSMVELRPDWCLSRQRIWGVPIPVFYCKNCKKPIITEETIKEIEQQIRENGSDIWFEKEEKQLLPENFLCPYCGGNEFEKEKDILDVWFDSGVSNISVLKEKYGLKWPADLYLEGSDQHRGWFQTSLIVSCGTKGKAPYKDVVTHGFVVDAEGKKMSKSIGNVITPDQIIKKYGAEILRLWAVSENYQKDIRISEEIIKNLSKTYRNIRNTIRFLLGNLYDFEIEEKIEYDNLFEVDRWAINKLKEVVRKVDNYYNSFNFNKGFEEINNFCNISLSSFYLDYLKDRLYTYGKNSKERKTAQQVLLEILSSLLMIISPVLSFTSEEAYQFLKWKDKESIFLNTWPDLGEPDKKLLDRWEQFFQVRKDILKKIEEKREEKLIGSSLEVKVTIKTEKEQIEFLKSFQNIEKLLMVSQVNFIEGKEEIIVEKTDYKKCQRCWGYFPEVGRNTEFPDLCDKCIKVIKENVNRLESSE